MLDMGWLSSTYIISLSHLPSLSSSYMILLFPFSHRFTSLVYCRAPAQTREDSRLWFGCSNVWRCYFRGTWSLSLSPRLPFLSIFVIFFVFFVFFCVFFWFFFLSFLLLHSSLAEISEKTYCMSLVSHVIVHAMPSLSRIFSLDSLCVSLVFFF